MPDAPAPPRLAVLIRRVEAPDIPAVAALDFRSATAADYWPEATYRARLAGRAAGLVAFVGPGGPPVAAMAYTAQPDRLDLDRLVVAPEARRRGVGRQMFARLRGRLDPDPDPGARRRIVARVPEDVDPGVLAFFRAMGFRGEGVEADYFVHADAWRLAFEAPAAGPPIARMAREGGRP